jgi:ABC-type phosphate/phosphonate transport system substrate-binding protein
MTVSPAESDGFPAARRIGDGDVMRHPGHPEHGLPATPKPFAFLALRNDRHRLGMTGELRDFDAVTALRRDRAVDRLRPGVRGLRTASILLAVLLTAACSMVQPTAAPLGSEQNPVKLALAPTSDTPKVLAVGEALARQIGREAGLSVTLSLPTSHPATVEGMSTASVDVAWLAPLGYLLARERVGAEPLLAAVREGSTSSASLAPLPGILAPLAMPMAQAPPDIREQLRALVRSRPIPHDVIAVRKGIPPALVLKLRDGLLRVAESPDGAGLLHDLYGIDGLAPVTDADFESLRAAVRLLDLNLDAALAPRTASPR